jgi:hypothetical protein
VLWPSTPVAPAQRGTGATVIDPRRAALLFSSLSVLSATTCGCALWHGRGSGDDAGITRAIDAGPLLTDAATGASDAGPCAEGSAFFQPGCVTEGIRITPGCYQPCTGPEDRTCASGMICQTTQIDPCGACAPGLDCCTVCAAEEWLCLPWHSTPAPTPAHCEGRDYCACGGECTPLIDLTTGCVCQCDEPFLCGGPACVCDCGGATYLGCAAASACASPEIRCTPPQRAQIVGGCPTCVAP